MDIALGPVTARHRDDLARFKITAHRRQPWVETAAQMVREYLPDALDHGTEALGAWHGDLLVGVIAWTPDREAPLSAWSSDVLAVRDRYVRKSIGRRLKEAELDAARAAGIATVVSVVHFGNDPMLGLNRSLGATLERVDRDYFYCVIAL